jgi:TonB family protein
MIARRKIVKRASSNKCLALGAVVALMVATFASARPPDNETGAADLRVSFLQDSSSDRKPASTIFPNYPSIARRDRIEGEATVCFKIDVRGKVKRASIRSYTHKIFKKPALRAMKSSSFEPLQPGQVLGRVKTCRTYRFRLEPILAEEAGQ